MSLSDRSAPLWPLIALILVAIYIAANPPLAAAASRLVPVVFSLTFAAAFIGWGALPSLALVPDTRPTDRLLVALVIGAGLTAVATFVPGVLGLVNPSFYAVWTLVGLALLTWKGRPLLTGISIP